MKSDSSGQNSENAENPVHFTTKTTRDFPKFAFQLFSTSARGTAVVSIFNFPGITACIASFAELSNSFKGILDIPLPMSVIDDERRSALGSVIVGALIEPI